MGDRTGIEWTDATWNPVTGCTKVSPGCDHCYAETIALRFAGTKAFPDGFAVTLRPDRLAQPLRWRRPRRVFVNSMSDLFHRGVPDDYIARVFAVMAGASRHTFQVLTKRPGRMRSLLNSQRFVDKVRVYYTWADDDPSVVDYENDSRPEFSVWPLPNVWLGVSVENQRWAKVRIPVLLQTPAAVRFLSCEPLLGPVDLVGAFDDGCKAVGPAMAHEPASYPTDYGTGVEHDCVHTMGIDWVIAGGESGRDSRPMHPDWPRSLRDQCAAFDVPFLFKQWGEFIHDVDPAELATYSYDTSLGDIGMWRVGKKRAGRLLDGRTHDEFPEVCGG
jgi:protein gp37